jgi:hypothetical protein
VNRLMKALASKAWRAVAWIGIDSSHQGAHCLRRLACRPRGFPDGLSDISMPTHSQTI